MAEWVKDFLSPAEIVFMPAGDPWLKKGINISRADDRLAMVELAVAPCSGFSVSTIEIERSGPTYTVDTMRELRAGLPSESELYFIMGWDNLLDLPRWHKPQELLQLCRLVAVPRIGSRIPDKMLLESLLPGLSERVILLSQPELDISASVIRERVGLGLGIRNMVPDTVERYIRQNGLYRRVSN